MKYPPESKPGPSIRILIMGIGAFAQGAAQILADNGATTFVYLTRDYGHFPPSLATQTFLADEYPDPCVLVEKLDIQLIIPMSIDWAESDWSERLLAMDVGILCPAGEPLRIERERDFARQLCVQYNIPFPESCFAADVAGAREFVKSAGKPFVLKNPLCAPGSPIHTIICETTADTLQWLSRIDDRDGIFLQEYMGTREAGHVAFVSGGEIYSLATNQEYKRAFTGNMGVVAGAPLGGIVEVDPHDKYGLADALIRPLLPWFKAVNYHGPLQVTGIYRDGQWSVLEYNSRLGVTCTNMILRLLKNPADVVNCVGQNLRPNIEFREGLLFGCSLTLAGYGYPFIKLDGPLLPVNVEGEFSCDVWWNEVTGNGISDLAMTGHRIADVIAVGEELAGTIAEAYENIARIRCLSSYYRLDVGKCLWPPGEA